MGACSSSGPQLSNALPQVKGKFKHGGPKALVDKVPRQAALGKAGESHITARLQQGLLAARISRGILESAWAPLSPFLEGGTCCTQVLALAIQTDWQPAIPPGALGIIVRKVVTCLPQFKDRRPPGP